MKSKFQLAALALAILSTINSELSTIHAQGSLTPPSGTPAPVMKSLAQVEPRTPISNAGYTISTPGSYYLTTNLVANTDGIFINASGVTLDLNGFTIKNTSFGAYAYSGISIGPSARNVTIKNGFIQGGVTNNGSGTFTGNGFGVGINGYSPFGTPENIHVSKVSVIGCEYFGIRIAGSSVVESCTATSMKASGINASIIKSCIATDCGGEAIHGFNVSDSRGESYGHGLIAETANNCTGTSVNGIGLTATIATGCTGSRSLGRAIQATVANSCFATAGTNLITYKYNMP